MQTLTHPQLALVSLAIVAGIIIACACLWIVLRHWQREVFSREQGREPKGFEVMPRPNSSRTFPDPLSSHPEIADVNIAPDAFSPADEQDWPTESR